MSVILVVGSVASSSITAIGASAIINPSFGKTTTTPIKHLVVLFQENVPSIITSVLILMP